MKKRILQISLFLFSFSAFAADDLCLAISHNDFKSVEKIMARKISKLADDDSYEYNGERLDTLKYWLDQQPCVIQSYWNKNQAYILITTTFTIDMVVQFKMGDSIVEKCFNIRTSKMRYGDRLFWEFGVEAINKHLKYLSVRDCGGYIKRSLAIDSSNKASMELQRHNYTVRFTSELVNNNRHRGSYYAFIEGEPLRMRLTVENVSDTIQKIIWPGIQNHGKKIIYFELLDEKGNHILTENRQVSLSHNETITHGILTLQPGQKWQVVHSLGKACINPPRPIECHHDLGMIQEGKYKLKTWYNPFGISTSEEIWLPRQKDSLAFRYQNTFNIQRSVAYNSQLNNVRYSKTATNIERSQVVMDVKTIDNVGQYLYNIGQTHFDAVGVIEKVVKGNAKVGDTIAFTFRYDKDLVSNIKTNVRASVNDDVIKMEIKNGGQSSFRIYATQSLAHFYQVVQADSDKSYLKGKRNYQLINFPGSIERIPNEQEKSK